MSVEDIRAKPDRPSDGRFLYRLRLFVEVVQDDGSLFYEGQYQATYHDQSRAGVLELEQTLIDLLEAQLELGRQAAKQHVS